MLPPAPPPTLTSPTRSVGLRPPYTRTRAGLEWTSTNEIPGRTQWKTESPNAKNAKSYSEDPACWKLLPRTCPFFHNAPGSPCIDTRCSIGGRRGSATCQAVVIKYCNSKVAVPGSIGNDRKLLASPDPACMSMTPRSCPFIPSNLGSPCKSHYCGAAGRKETPACRAVIVGYCASKAGRTDVACWSFIPKTCPFSKTLTGSPCNFGGAGIVAPPPSAAEREANVKAQGVADKAAKAATAKVATLTKNAATAATAAKAAKAAADKGKVDAEDAAKAKTEADTAAASDKALTDAKVAADTAATKADTNEKTADKAKKDAEAAATQAKTDKETADKAKLDAKAAVDVATTDTKAAKDSTLTSAKTALKQHR